MNRDFWFAYIIILRSNLERDFQAKVVLFNLVSTMELLGSIRLAIQKQLYMMKLLDQICMALNIFSSWKETWGSSEPIYFILQMKTQRLRLLNNLPEVPQLAGRVEPRTPDSITRALCSVLEWLTLKSKQPYFKSI